MRTLKRIGRDTLDYLYDVTEPFAGTCPVCAFWRGFAIATVGGFIGELVAKAWV